MTERTIQVTKSNFFKFLPEIESNIQNCSFLSMDLELTGLTAGANTRPSYFDSFQHRYSKQRESVKSLLPTQFGLSLFTWDKESQNFKCAIYSFSIFPSHKHTKEMTFLSDASAFVFLAENNFDFNKWIHQGISFMTYSHEEGLRDQLNIDKGEEEEEERTYDSWTQQFVVSIMKEIEEWNDTDSKEWTSIRKLNKFRRSVVTKEVKKKFGEGSIYVFEDTTEDQYCEVKLIKMATPSEREKFNREIEEKNNQVINDAIGFRKVIDAIISSKKPFLCHNGFYDLLHSYHRFIDFLPETLQQWKQDFNKLIPVMIDTKQLCSNPIFLEVFGKNQETSLGDVYKFMTKTNSEFVNSMPKIVFDLSHPESLSQAHDAGYDAYMTGLIFIGLSKFLTKSSFNDFTLDHPEVVHYVNRIPLGSYGFDIKKPCLFLAGVDQPPVNEKEDTFYITGYDENVNMEEIEKYFSEFSQVSRLKLSFCFDYPHVHLVFSEPPDSIIMEKLKNPFQEYPCVSFSDFCLMTTYAEENNNDDEEGEDDNNEEENEDEDENMEIVETENLSDSTGQLKRKRDLIESENFEGEQSSKKFDS